MGIRIDKVHRFIRAYDGTRYLKSFDLGKHNEIFNGIRYLVGVKSGIAYVISYNYAKTKVYSYDSLPLEKTSTFQNVIILIMSVF